MATHKHSGIPVIEVNNLTVMYADLFALQDVNFTIHQGDLCALVGPNGAGKSTLFKALLGLLKPTSGSIKLAGLDSFEARKQGLIGYVPQHEDIDPSFPLGVEDVVMQGRYGMMNILRHPSREDKRAVDQALDRVGLGGFAKRRIAELSGGQRKRVFVARALAQQAHIMLMDEPYAGVDKRSESQLSELVRSLTAEGVSALVAVHDLHAVSRQFNEAMLLNKTVLAHDVVDDALSIDNLSDAFEVTENLVKEMVS